jgi:hypothetical protein
MRYDFFSQSYSQARARFRDLASSARVRVATFELPVTQGADDEVLTTDIAWLGPQAPRGAVILTSGTHGIEGYAGSAFQCWLLAQRSASWLPGDVAVILVHAINPFGFANGCRVNEHNVDLNRNFIDFSRVLPPSTGYDRLHDAIVPKEWSGETKARADEVIRNAWNDLGERGFQDAVCRGQYSHPDGLFYGGLGPSWSHSVWRNCLADLPRSIELLAHIDVHTGLGPFGYGEVLYTLPVDVPAFTLASEWYEELGLRAAGSRESAATTAGGTINHAVIELQGVRDTMSVSVEFGTVEFRRMFDALRADNWLRLRGPPGFAEAAEIRQELARCFYPADVGWRDSMVERCDQVLTHTLAGVKERLAERGGGPSHPK